MKKHIAKKKILLIVSGMLLLIFIIVNALWFWYRYTYFTKIANKHPEFVIQQTDSVVKSPLYKEYVFRDMTPHVQDTTYNYSISFPLRYLSFSGNYAMSQCIIIDTDNNNQVVNNFAIMMYVKPTLLGRYRYEMQITDYTDYKKMYYLQLSDQCELIADDKGDAEIILDKANAEIREAMDSVKTVFGLS